MEGDEMTEGQGPLLAALAKAQAQAQGVEKGSVNTFHRYKYASAEDVIAVSREALAGTGLAFVCTSATVAWGEPAVLTCRYALIHESGASLEITSETPVIPEKGRPEDKAVATAKTYDLGYALRGLLLLPRVEEGADADQRDDRHREPRARGPRKPEPAAPPTPTPTRSPKAVEALRIPEAAQAIVERVVQALPSAQVARVGLDPEHELQLAGLSGRTRRAALVRRCAKSGIGAADLAEWLGRAVTDMGPEECAELEELVERMEAGVDSWEASLDHRLGELARKGA
jgi:hypothetical protein